MGAHMAQTEHPEERLGLLWKTFFVSMAIAHAESLRPRTADICRVKAASFSVCND